MLKYVVLFCAYHKIFQNLKQWKLASGSTSLGTGYEMVPQGEHYGLLF